MSERVKVRKNRQHQSGRRWLAECPRCGWLAFFHSGHRVAIQRADRHARRCSADV